jgi:hypothetical protein
MRTGVGIALLVASIASAAMWACSSDSNATPTVDGGDDAAAPANEAGSSDADRTGDDGAGPSADAAGNASLGATCTHDDECTGGLVCWMAGVEARFPAHGLCSKKCTSNPDCDAVKPGAVCFKLGASPSAGNWCGEPCTLGPGQLTSLRAGANASKCHGRADMACQSYGGTACGPACNDDSQCGPDAVCNGATGLCAKGENTPWTDVGASQPDGGGCPFGTRPLATLAGTLCTATCTLGVVPSCRWGGAADAGAPSACVFRPTNQGAGDLGFCGKLCDCASDCPSSLPCTELPASWQAETGRHGVCGGTGGEIVCDDAGAPDAGGG